MINEVFNNNINKKNQIKGSKNHLITKKKIIIKNFYILIKCGIHIIYFPLFKNNYFSIIIIFLFQLFLNIVNLIKYLP